MLLCAWCLGMCALTLSSYRWAERDRKRETWIGSVGKDVVFVGCKSKLSVWWKPARLTPKQTMTLSLLCIVMIRTLGVKIKMYNNIHMKNVFLKSVLVRITHMLEQKQPCFSSEKGCCNHPFARPWIRLLCIKYSKKHNHKQLYVGWWTIGRRVLLSRLCLALIKYTCGRLQPKSLLLVALAGVC